MSSSFHNQLSVDLVDPAVWRPLIAAAAEAPALAMGDRLRLKQLAEALLTLFHDRHVGLTPALAAGLAFLLLERDQQRVGPPWRAVIERLRRELRRVGAEQLPNGRTPLSKDGFVLRDAPSFTVLRLAIPLVARACRAQGASLLFCADPVAGGVGRDAYARYAEELDRQFFAIAVGDQEDQGAEDHTHDDAPFWVEVALGLAGRALASEPGGVAPPLPEMEPLDLAWLLRLRPDPEPRPPSEARPRVMFTPQKRQKSRKLREGGITGYKLTRRPEDLDDIVLSELLYPDEIVYERVLNEGYLVMERPPRHQKRRDVLAVGVFPPGVGVLPAAGMLKAAWFDCMWRFAAFLRSQDLTRSEIRWIEGAGAAQARSASYLLSELPGITAEPNPSPGERWMFLRSLHWVPSFLNRRDRPTLLQLPPKRLAPGDADAPPLPDGPWMRAAWEAQRENTGLDPVSAQPTRPRSWPEAVAEFAHTHLMVFLPATLLDPYREQLTERTAAISLFRRLRLHFPFVGSAGTYMSLTMVPAQPLAGDQWLVVTPAGVFGLEQAAATPEGITGALEALWLKQLVKEMGRG